MNASTRTETKVVCFSHHLSENNYSKKEAKMKEAKKESIYYTAFYYYTHEFYLCIDQRIHLCIPEFFKGEHKRRRTKKHEKYNM